MIQIGTSLAGSGVGGSSGNPSSDSDRVLATRLFGADSYRLESHNFHVDMTGGVVHAFGLVGTDVLTLQMVVGCKEGDLYEDVSIKGETFTMTGTPLSNILLVPLPGRYRLRYTGTNLGGFYAFYYAAQLPAMNAAMPMLSKLLGL